MKVKLLVDVPVDPKHGMTKGRVLEVLGSVPGGSFVWVMGDAGEKIKVLGHEYQFVKDDDEDQVDR